MASLVICMQLRFLFHEFQRRWKRHKNYLRVVNSMEARYRELLVMLNTRWMKSGASGLKNKMQNRKNYNDYTGFIYTSSEGDVEKSENFLESLLSFKMKGNLNFLWTHLKAMSLLPSLFVKVNDSLKFVRKMKVSANTLPPRILQLCTV